MDHPTGTRTPRRRWPAALAAALAAPALLLTVTGTAWAEAGDPGNPYVWDCGTSRSGGVYVEVYGATSVTVKLFGGGADRTVRLPGNVYHQFVDGGGGKGSAQIYADATGPDQIIWGKSSGGCSPTP